MSSVVPASEIIGETCSEGDREPLIFNKNRLGAIAGRVF